METHNASQCVIWAAVMLVVGLVAGVFASPYLPFSVSNAKNDYEAGFNAAKALVENSTIGATFKTPDDVRSLSGTVASVEGNSIALHLFSSNPFDDQALLDRTVLVAPATQIFKLALEKPKGTTTTAVQSFIPTKVDISAVKIGDTLMITAPENVKTLKEFTASEIQIQPTLPK